MKIAEITHTKITLDSHNEKLYNNTNMIDNVFQPEIILTDEQIIDYHDANNIKIREYLVPFFWYVI